jgi:hypothetical protein
MPRSTRFSVRIKDSSGTWKALDVLGDINGYDYAHFSVGPGGCDIEVTSKEVATIGRYRVTPEKDNLPSSVSGNRITYSIPNDKYTVVSIDGAGKRLIVAADPLHTPPNPADAHVFNVMTRAGVRGDRSNIVDTTNGIQAAIDAASAYNGSANEGRGIVYVPAGAYAVGNITLKPEMELYLAEGAAFFFAGNVTTNQGSYKYRTNWTTKGNGTRWITTQDDASGIKIWGRGTLDANGLASKDFFNNVLVFNHNHHVTVDGIVIKAGGKWGTMLGRTDDATFSHVKFFQHMSGVGEDDGLDVIESQNVVVRDSIAASFDDSFSIKTYDGTEAYVSFGGAHQSATNITFDNVIAWTGCHALKIGQGTGQTTENVTFKNSVVFDAAHGVSLHHKAGRGIVRNVTWDTIDIEAITQTNLGRSWAYFNIESTQSGAGKIADITVKNIRVRDPGTDASPVNGLDAVNDVDGLSFRNIYIGPTGNGFFAQNAADIHVQKNAFVSNLQVSQDGVRMFWDRDAVRVDGASDWSSGNYKANCGPGEAMTGLSQAAGQPGPHAARCKAYGAPFGDTFAAAQLVSTAGDSFRAGHSLASYDWDPGFAKTECGSGEYVSGVSQQVGSHSLAHLRCAAGPITVGACNSKSVTSDDRGESTGDWDPGYTKGECATDMIVVGVSTSAAGKPRRILCCHK